jgi:hypothetical protein
MSERGTNTKSDVFGPKMRRSGEPIFCHGNLLNWLFLCGGSLVEFEFATD